MANGSGARGERVSARLRGGAREREVRGLLGRDGGAESRGFIVSGGLRAPRGPGGSREETLGGALQWGGGGREQHRGEYLRGDAPEPQERLSDIRLVCGIGGWPGTCRPCKFQGVESGHPSPQRTERQAAQRFPRNPGASEQRPGDGGEENGCGEGVGSGGRRDAGASRRIRDLTSFSEERGLLRAGEQNSLLRRGAKEGCSEGLLGERGRIEGGWELRAPQLVFMNVSDFMNEAGFFRWLLLPAAFFSPPLFVNEALSLLPKTLG